MAKPKDDNSSNGASGGGAIMERNLGLLSGIAMMAGTMIGGQGRVMEWNRIRSCERRPL